MTTVPAQAGPAEPRFPSPYWRSSPLRTAASRYIHGLWAGYRKDRPYAVATLARLRRGIGHPVEADPDLWGLIGMEEFLDDAQRLPDAPEPNPWLRPSTLERAETALHLAITLWALHQQSHRDAPMHVPRYGFGRSVRFLMDKKKGSGSGNASGDARPGEGTPAPRKAEKELDEPLRKRFVRTAAASSFDELSQRLREMVLLLRAASVPLDYGLLADQLLRWQEPEGRALVHRFWGRDFHLAASRRVSSGGGEADGAGDAGQLPPDADGSPDLNPTAD
ncbi:type I-E CRISPR-associated protein Cse2/CasB [Streptomyces sp. URMC 129]|uniref:type I-E CRISPR-associated protein Cse2/CasB n=1 Tax=Streptomyces sp. URMC 129 TaxID=3423407 RepID=UPI003F199A4E